MGQGLYGAFGFGAVLTKKVYALIYKDGDLRVAVEHRPKTAYESRNEYIVYMIADTAGFTDEGGDQRYAVPLNALALDVARRYKKAYGAAKSNYAALVEAAKLIGVKLPEGRLIYVHDYD